MFCYRNYKIDNFSEISYFAFLFKDCYEPIGKSFSERRKGKMMP